MQRGFTLIEILIAMAIFTLIGLASTGLLTTVIDSNDISEERFASPLSRNFIYEFQIRYLSEISCVREDLQCEINPVAFGARVFLLR